MTTNAPTRDLVEIASNIFVRKEYTNEGFRGQSTVSQARYLYHQQEQTNPVSPTWSRRERPLLYLCGGSKHSGQNYALSQSLSSDILWGNLKRESWGRWSMMHSVHVCEVWRLLDRGFTCENRVIGGIGTARNVNVAPLSRDGLRLPNDVLCCCCPLLPCNTTTVFRNTETVSRTTKDH
jgi:hypothetical protein